MQGWNVRNPAVKRILQELRECQQDDSPDVMATAAEENLFEWHFAIRGTWESEFAGGIYHGRILLPADYPFKPPSFVMATPSGRWEVGTKICLSISSHHPESWQPSWSVRAALVALRVFMQTPGGGAVGALDSPADARRALALESRAWVPRSSSPATQEQLTALHAAMLESEPASKALHAGLPSPGEASEGPAGGETAAAPDSGREAEQVEAPEAAGGSPVAEGGVHESSPVWREADAGVASAAVPAEPATTASPEPAAAPAGAPLPAAVPGTAREALVRRTTSPDPRPAVAVPLAFPAFLHGDGPPAVHAPTATMREDRGLTYLALLLVLCILAIMIRKVFLVMHVETDEVYYSFTRTPMVEL